MKKGTVGILPLTFMLILVSGILFSCSAMKKNSCNCPSKKGMVGY